MPQPLIYLAGMPRSGTTWIAKIFDSHPDTLYRHEPDSVERLTPIPFAPDVDDWRNYSEVLQAYAARLPDIRVPKVAASMPVFPKSYYSPARYALRRGLAVLAKSASRLWGKRPLPNWINFREAPQLHVVWKSIESLARLGVMARALPHCRAIHLLRHPCGYAASVLRGESQGRFDGGSPSSEDYGLFEMLLQTGPARRHGLDRAALQSLHPVERLAWRWALVNEKALDDANGLANCRVVRYEDVCLDPQGEARSMFEFAGLAWHLQTESFIAQSTSSEKATYYTVFKNPARSAAKWKDELAGDDIDRICRTVEHTAPGKLYLVK